MRGKSVHAGELSWQQNKQRTCAGRAGAAAHRAAAQGIEPHHVAARQRRGALPGTAPSIAARSSLNKKNRCVGRCVERCVALRCRDCRGTEGAQSVARCAARAHGKQPKLGGAAAPADSSTRQKRRERRLSSNQASRSAAPRKDNNRHESVKRAVRPESVKRACGPLHEAAPQGRKGMPPPQQTQAGKQWLRQARRARVAASAVLPR